MPVQNAEIAAMFDETAELLEIKGDNPFRSRAYRRAAQMIRHLPERVADMVATGSDLSTLPGIGADLSGKIADIAATGKFDLLDALRRDLPAGLAALAALPGLGPKRVRLLHEDLGVGSVEDLRRVAHSGRLRTLRGFGPKREQTLLAALDKPVLDKRYSLSMVEAEARALTTYLRQHIGTGEVVAAGSLRRRRDTIGDLDILVAGAGGVATGDCLVAYENVADTISRGPTRTSVVLRSGLQVDLRTVPGRSFGAALMYLTGSKAHNIALRTLASERGWTLNEYGLFDGERRIAGTTESEIYARLGLAFIPPELRENTGEIALAAAGKLPGLVTLADIRGDLHVHSDWSDGTAPIAVMADAARQRGYAYVAITDHSRHLTVAHGLDPARLSRQMDEIDRLNDQFDDFTILKGAEVDILAEGQLDLPDAILSRLDLVIAAVHHKFELPRAAQTDRVIRALDNRHVSILAHPTGRMIGLRPPYAIDMPRLIEAAAARGCLLEMNAEPDRLDLAGVDARAAKARGVGVAISTDAHAIAGLDNMRLGVDQARRGWLEPADVVNTLPLAALRKRLKR
jgi:DNA polymerase (family 10)